MKGLLAAALVGAVLPSDARAQCDPQHFIELQPVDDGAFGVSCAMSGDLALVGAAAIGPLTLPGRVYAFTRDPQWGWVVDGLLGPIGQPGDAFGTAVDLDGTRALVGARHHVGPFLETGRAFLYRKVSISWVPEAELLSTGPDPFGHFGAAVAVDGSRALVGAPGESTSLLGSVGVVYVYENGPSGWVEVARLLAASPNAFERFGESVALDGTRVLVGAPDAILIPSGVPAGEVHAFEDGPSGWTATQFLTPSDLPSGARFGASLVVEGDFALVGAPERDGAFAASGAVYAFERVANAWVEVQVVESADPSPDARFGAAISIHGTRAVIGAPGDGAPGATGRAYTFDLTTTGWVQTGRYEGDEGDSLYGAATAVGNDGFLIGAPFEDGFLTDAGATYAYDSPASASAFCDCTSGSPCLASSFGGCEHAGGEGGVLEACGTAGAGADDLVLVASRLPANQFGLVFMGSEQAAIPLANGLRCVGTGPGGLHRFPTRFSGVDGRFEEGPGIVAFSQSSFPAIGHIDAGETWSFQTWFREPAGACPGTSNLTNAVRVTFAP